MYQPNPDRDHPAVDRESYPEVAPTQHDPMSSPQAVHESDLEHLPTYQPPKQEQDYYNEAPYEASRPPTAQKYTWRRSRLWIAALAVIAVLAIALGVGLGVGLKRQASTDTTSAADSASPTTSATTSSTRSAATSAPTRPPPTNCSGIKYCGWELKDQLGVSIDDLIKAGGEDPPNDLYLCTSDNQLQYVEDCGGPYHCQPPVYNRAGCNSTLGLACCD